MKSNNSLGHSFSTNFPPKQSRQAQMYSSIISNAVQKSAFERVTKTANMSMMSAGGIGRRSGTTGSTAAFDGKVNVGLSTSSSIRSHGPGEMPHLVPQKTNVLTGASTKYFNN